jgi:hypothetical protein
MSDSRSLTGTSLAAETTLRPGPIANRPQDAILPYIWHQQNQKLACGFLESAYATSCYVLSGAFRVVSGRGFPGSTSRKLRLVLSGKNAGGSAPARRQATKTPARSIFSSGTPKKPVTGSGLLFSRTSSSK